MTKAFKALDLPQICTRVKSASANHLMHYIKLPSRLSGKLTPAQLAVLFTLASFGPVGEFIEASVSEIAECAHVCKKNVKRTIDELERMTLISVHKRSGYAHAYVVTQFE
jgi:DNA-binding MarR family transcriptional regulator